MSMFQISNVSKAYDTRGEQKRILHHIHLNVGEREIVGLVGESGSGKSTLARLMMRLEPWDEGEMFFKNENISKMSRTEFYRQCQMVFQNAASSLNPSWTVRKILSEPLRSFRGNIDVHLGNELEKVRLDKSLLNRKPGELSGGEKQRVNLLRSLLVEPQLLVCDEIVSNLDRINQKEIVNLLLEINREMGMGILFISHDIKVVEYMCNRIYIMKEGRIVEESRREEEGFHFAHPYATLLFS